MKRSNILGITALLLTAVSTQAATFDVSGLENSDVTANIMFSYSVNNDTSLSIDWSAGTGCVEATRTLGPEVLLLIGQESAGLVGKPGAGHSLPGAGYLGGLDRVRDSRWGERTGSSPGFGTGPPAAQLDQFGEIRPLLSWKHQIRGWLGPVCALGRRTLH